MWWQSELHSEPSMLAVGAEHNSGRRAGLSQLKVKYTVLISRMGGLTCTVHTVLQTLQLSHNFAILAQPINIRQEQFRHIFI